jgi:Flp pilus assembly protein CpaB
VELEYSDRNRRRSKVYIAAGSIVALLVAATVYLALQASGLTQADEVVTRDVVVASTALSSRQTVTAGDVSVRRVIADPTNESGFTSVDDVVGRVVSVPVVAGQLMTPNLLASSTEGQTYSILEPGQAFDPNSADMRAMSVSVEDASAVAGTLVAGQRVDLIVTMPINPQIEPPAENSGTPVAAHLAGPSTKVTLQDMTILARNGIVYILRADVATAEKIVELTAAGGTFTMALRPDEDDRLADTEGSTIDRLIEEYGFPVPRPVEFDETPAAAGN